MRNFVQPGETLTVAAPVGGVTSGQGVLIGDLFGVAAYTADATDDVEIQTTGVFDLTKQAGAGVTFAVGAVVYWDATNSRATATATDQPIGVCVSAAVNSDTSVRTLLGNIGLAGAIADLAADAATGAAHAVGTGADHTHVAASTLKLAATSADQLGVVHTAQGTWDATGGKAIGSYAFGPSLPDNAIVIKAFYRVLTTFTSAGDLATIALGVQSDAAAGIKVAVAINNGANPWDAGNHDAIPDGAAANMVTQLTAARQFLATVAVEAITAGVLQVFAQYVLAP